MALRYSIPMRSIAASLAIMLTVGSAGCSTIAPADIAPIESQTEVLFGQVQFDLKIEDIILLNPYLDEETPATDAFEASSNDLFATAELLVGYSTDIIELARLGSDRELVSQFVPVFRSFYDDILAVPSVRRHMAAIDIDAISQAAAEERSATLALRAAGPMHSAVADAIREAIIESEDFLQAAFEELYDKIADEFSPFMAYWSNLADRHNVVLEELLLLDLARDGAADAWQTLLSGDEQLRDELGEDTALSRAAVDEAETILVARLAKLVDIWDHLQPDYTNYQAVLRELYAVQANANGALQIASVVIDSWDDAQRELAAGQPSRFVAVTQDLLSIAIKRNAR